jgi:hypothetical protein
MESTIEQLNNGECPVCNKWEDGLGNICTLEGWSSSIKYDKETFRGMIEEWQNDNPEEYAELAIEEPTIDEDRKEWIAYAYDGNHYYTLTDDGRGNIIINY